MDGGKGSEAANPTADQIMDMGRTAVNVMGNCIATAVVARWEGVFDDEKMRAFVRGASRAA